MNTHDDPSGDDDFVADDAAVDDDGSELDDLTWWWGSHPRWPFGHGGGLSPSDAPFTAGSTFRITRDDFDAVLRYSADLFFPPDEFFGSGWDDVIVEPDVDDE